MCNRSLRRSRVALAPALLLAYWWFSPIFGFAQSPSLYIEYPEGDIITGNEIREGYADWHRIEEFDHSYYLYNQGGGGQAPSGIMVKGLYHFAKPLDYITPQLARFLSEGTTIHEVRIAFFQIDPTEGELEFLRMTLNNVRVYKQDIEKEHIPGEATQGYEHIYLYAGQATWEESEIGGVLALSLVDFRGVAEGRDVVVSWTAELEQGITHYELQHLRGSGFETIEYIQAHIFTDRPVTYQARLAGLSPGRHIFRLKAVSLDGHVEIGNEIEVQIGLQGERMRLLELHPNPSGAETRFDLTVEADQDVHAALYDVLGRKVRVLHDGLLTGGSPHTFRLDVRDLPQGLYLLRIMGSNFDETRALRVLH